MTQRELTELLTRLVHYSFAYIPSPRWNEAEAAVKAQRAHLDGLEIEELVREGRLSLRKVNDF